VLSSAPLPDNQLFEVRIDKKINSWSGSIEVGVTCCDPNTIDVPFPSSATELREGTWIMSGNSILKDGRSINENYGTDLDKLEEGDRVGVLRTGLGDLIFFVNGIAQGVAAGGLPPRVFAVIDMYGKCAQVGWSTKFLCREVSRNISLVFREIIFLFREIKKINLRNFVSRNITKFHEISRNIAKFL
jgi:hypothetical protein